MVMSLACKAPATLAWSVYCPVAIWPKLATPDASASATATTSEWLDSKTVAPARGRAVTSSVTVTLTSDPFCDRSMGTSAPAAVTVTCCRANSYPAARVNTS